MLNKVKSAFSGKRITVILTISFAVLVLPSVVLAQNNQQGQGGIQQQDRVQDATVHEVDVVIVPPGNQVQNQVKTRNAGEDSQLEVNTQESLQANEERVGSQGRSETARQNMSVVAKKVEELLSDETVQGGIGQQVKDLASQQKQAQGEIKGQLDKLESRQGLMKKLFGTDQKAIKNLKRQMEQNQLRIQQLQELQAQVTNQAEETQIQLLTQALVEQNTALAEQVQAEEEVGSVFGWLVKLFNR